MATVSQAVVVRIHIQKGNADVELENVGRRGVNAFGALSRIISTVSKALVSMVAVLVAFNLFITLPERIAQGFVSLAKASIMAANEMQQQILSIGGLLASFRSFDTDLTNSFNVAVQQGERLVIMMTEAAAETLATTEDLMIVFQRLVAGGGLAYVKSLQEAVSLTKLLADMTLALAGTNQKQKQLVSETDALMQGEARSGAMLARILKSQVGDLQTYLNERKAEKNLLQDLEKRFGGIAMAAKAQGQTLEGLFSAVVSYIKIINFEFSKFGAAKFLLDIFKGWQTTLSEVTKELFNASKIMSGDLSKDTMAVLDIFTNLNVAIIQISKGIHEFFRKMAGENGDLEAVKNGFGVLLSIATTLRVVFRRIGQEINDTAITVSTLINVAKELLPAGLGGNMGFIERLQSGRGAIWDASKALDALSKNLIIRQNRESLSSELNSANAEARILAETIQRDVLEMLKNLGGAFLDLGTDIADAHIDDELASLRTDLTHVLQDLNLELNNKVLQSGDIFTAYQKEVVGFLRKFAGLKDTQEYKEALGLIETLFRFDQEKKVQDILDENRATLMKWMQDGGMLRGVATSLPEQDAFSKLASRFVIERADLVIDRFSGLRNAIKDIVIGEKDFAEAQRELDGLMKDGLATLATNAREMARLNDEWAKLKDPAILEQIDQLRNKNAALIELMKALKMELKEVNQEFYNIDNAIKRIENAKGFWETLIRLVKELSAQLAFGLMTALEDVFAAMVDGVDDGVTAFERLAAGMLNALADILRGLAMALLFKGIFTANPAMIAASAGAFAAAGVLRGLASRFTRPDTKNGNSSGVGSSGGAGRQLLVFQPVNQGVGANFEQSLERLNGNLERLEAMPASSVVAMGAQGASKEIAVATVSEMNKNSKVRHGLVEAVQGA